MTEKSTAGRKPNYTDDDIADAIADLRFNGQDVNGKNVCDWLKAAGIAKAPSAEAVKKVIQRVLEREKEAEKRRLLAALPSGMVEELQPGMEELTSHVHMLLARAHRDMQKTTESSLNAANASMEYRDKRIAALEDDLEASIKKAEQLTEQLAKAQKRIGSLLTEREKLKIKASQLATAKKTLEEVVKTFKDP
ncbi:hypothetical protein BMG03_19650 (plasmid) [Thioclava nitratireducens]|uniref:KfrA N-terminal DNA-binding domain-containing protein n=1 Tax=Thioclava nitratireducens TaxID=1915078 RepID=A0ABM6IMB8_9RHOB|nr:hypothetical protein [Thioclava nitratireducens]AQS50128.1 hypothetical protein BMG03_19650 [Thioclava nitratireducens]